MTVPPVPAAGRAPAGAGAVRSLERPGVSRSIAMTFTRHKTPNIRRRDANVAEHDLRAAGLTLAHRLQDVNHSVTTIAPATLA